MRRPLPSLLVALAASWLLHGQDARADELSPEVQLCLQHLRDGERARLAAAVGPIEELPLYRVQLEVDPSERKVKGRAQVLYVARGRTLEAVYLRVTPNAQGPRVKLSHATLNGQPAVLEQPEPTLYRVRLEPHVPPGGAAQVEVRLEATVPELPAASLSLMGGLAMSQGPRDYGAFAASPEVMLLSGILPMVPPLDDAGEPWPGPSGMGDLATFEPSMVVASITAPSGFTVIATGAALGEVPQKDGRVRYSFAAAGVRDFPVIVAKGFEKAEAEAGGITVQSYFSPARAEAGKKALAQTKDAVALFDKRLGPLPHKVLRVVEAPLTSGAGGMEFSGLIVLSSALYQGAQDPAAALGLPPGFEQLFAGMGAGAGAGLGLGKMLGETLELTVAHEVAHQYFMGLVGSDPVRTPVVDEALAQYAALLYFEWQYGAAAAQRVRREHLVTPYHFFRLAGGQDAAASRPTSDFSGSTEYAALVYAKAPLLFAEQRKLVGDAAFFKALRGYLTQYRWRWSCGDCFTTALARANPQKSKALMSLQRRWWDEAHGDADLGQPSVAGMMEQLTGQKMDPKTEALLRQLLPHLTGP